jgi:ATP-binding cassette subfamily B protein
VRELARIFDVHERVACKALTLQAATPLMYEPCGVLVLIVTVLAGQSFGIPLSEVAVLLWALRVCIPLLGSLTTQKNSLLNFVPSYEQITSLRRRARELTQRSGERPFTTFASGIAVEHLTFAYPGHAPVLVDVTLSIPKGKMVAFVGESGVGKSTLIDLLMGFHEPTAGRILVDGVPLQDFDISSYRQRLGYVPQESVLFNMSIRDNLRWACDAATDADIQNACRQANAEEFIERFPDGYETIVGDRGVRLSGGQCQRVALARAILRKPEVLVLDEATSALDTHSERLIQQAIETVAKGTTVIVIAHRLSTIVNADYVYVLHEGRIVEEGTYQALVRQDGHFSRMTQMQLLESAA